MAEIINLRQARKKRGRDDRRKSGDENAARHGRSGADKARDAAEQALARRRLDGHRRAAEGSAEDAAPDEPDREDGAKGRDGPPPVRDDHGNAAESARGAEASGVVEPARDEAAGADGSGDRGRDDETTSHGPERGPDAPRG